MLYISKKQFSSPIVKMKIFTICLLFFHNYIAYSKNISTKIEIRRNTILNKVTCNSLHQNGGTWKSYCVSLGRVCNDSGDRAKCCKEGDETCIGTCTEEMEDNGENWISLCKGVNAECSVINGETTCVCKTGNFDKTSKKCIDPCKKGKPREIECREQKRKCVFNSGDNAATCGACLENYLEDDSGKCIDPCEEGKPKEIECTQKNRKCAVNSEDNVATCGACLKNYLEDGSGNCIDPCGETSDKARECKQKNKHCVLNDGDTEAFCSDCLKGFFLSDEGNCIGMCETYYDESKTWREFCAEIQDAKCEVNPDGTPQCVCKNYLEFDNDNKICKESCKGKRPDGKTWETYCSDIEGAVCSEKGAVPTCVCTKEDEIFDLERSVCKITCNSINPSGHIWKNYCASFGTICDDSGEWIKCCEEGDETCIDQCNRLMFIDDFKAITWRDFCFGFDGICVSSIGGARCECNNGKIFSDILEKCIVPCDENAMIDEYTTWKDFCSMIGAQCVSTGVETICECRKGLEYNRKVNICVEQCDKNAMKDERIKWKDFCASIGADCISSQEATTCLCESGKLYDNVLEKCVDRYATCDSVIEDGTKTWNEFCNEKGLGSCRIDENLPKCGCSYGKIFDHDQMDCVEEQLTCESVIPGGTKTWNQFCIEKELLCEDEGIQAECLCPYGRKFDRSVMDCMRDIPRQRNCQKKCLNNGYCSLNNSSEVCICPSVFTGEICEKPNFCKIHHEDGLSGEDYCERGDAECISEEKLVCRCYNPHRYFDYKTEMCINPCTTRPCRNGGRCIFKGTPNPICECNPYFTGNRCEEVNWCRIKRISGRTVERYCASNGAFCKIIETGKVDCVCEDNDFEFNHSLKKCIEIDLCAINRRGFQDCSLKNAICKKDINSRSGDKYICECPPGKKMLENGTCAENTICEKEEKGYEICNRRRAKCVINDFKVEGFECECADGYAPNDHGRCIDINICNENHEGHKECESRDAICLHNFDNDVGYECGCKPGYKMTGIGICIEITECDNGQIGYRECRARNANCIQDLRNYKKYKCVCPERYAIDINGRCRKKNFGVSYSLQTNNNVISYIDPCDEGNHGYIECMKINAICTSNNNSYSCECRPNQKLDSNGICTDLQPCDKGEIGFKECGILSSICIQNKALLKGYKCKCSELYVMDQFGRCIDNFHSK